MAGPWVQFNIKSGSVTNWNNYTSETIGTTLSSNVDENGDSTGITLTMDTVYGNKTNSGETSDNSPFPSTVRISNYYLVPGNGTQNWVFGGLDNSKTYQIQGIGSRVGTGSDRVGDISVDGQSDTIDARGTDAEEQVDFTGLSPTSTELDVSYAVQTTPSSSYAYIAGFRIREEDAGGTTVALTGQSSTSSQGTLTITGDALLTLTGQSTTSAQGALTIAGNAITQITGEEVTSAQGTLVISGQANVALTGQEITSAQGTVTVSIAGGTTIAISGQSSTVEQGTITTTDDEIVVLTGQEITGQQGTLSIATGNVIIIAGQAANSAQGSLGVFIGTPSGAPDAPGVVVDGSFGDGAAVSSRFGNGVIVGGSL